MLVVLGNVVFVVTGFHSLRIAITLALINVSISRERRIVIM